MGCLHSSTAATSAYPGNRRVAKPVYQPSQDEYKQIDDNTAVAQAHFVTCPGGNALRLLDRPNRAKVGTDDDGGLAKFISVTLPSGVHAGDVIHVKAPDGRLNAIVVPGGMGPVSTFTVEFSSDDLPPKEEEEGEEDMAPGVYVPTVTAELDTETDVPMTHAVVAQPTTEPYASAYAMK